MHPEGEHESTIERWALHAFILLLAVASIAAAFI
jgi:hypothetical protein